VPGAVPRSQNQTNAAIRRTDRIDFSTMLANLLASRYLIAQREASVFVQILSAFVRARARED
jgi:hypothetical protein